MTDDELSDIGRAWVGDRVGTHWDGCHLENRHHGCAVARLMAEVLRLRAELAEQKRVNVQLAERLAACSECLGRVAERRGVDLAAVVAAQAHKGGVAAVMGQWPGDETDEEIAAALAEKRDTVQGHTESGR